MGCKDASNGVLHDPTDTGQHAFDAEAETPSLSKLEWFIGDWYYEGPRNGRRVRTSFNNRWVLNSRFMLCDVYTEHVPPVDGTSVRELRFIEENNGAFRKWIFNNFGMHGVGDFRMEGTEMIGGILESDRAEYTTRGVIRRIDEDHFVSYSLEHDQEGKWRPVMQRRLFSRGEIGCGGFTDRRLASACDVNIGAGYVTSYEMLKRLKWLIGDWSYGDGADMHITRNTQWILGNSFLQSEVITSALTVKDAERPLREILVIGWDHHDKMYRQWTFNNLGHVALSVVNVSSDRDVDVITYSRVGAEDSETVLRTAIRKVNKEQIAAQEFVQGEKGEWIPRGSTLAFKRMSGDR